MSKFTSFSQVTAYDADGKVLIVGTNHPTVEQGEIAMKQQPLMAIISKLNCYGFSDQIADLKIEHHPLEGDYEVWCDPRCMTDFGLRYAIARCYDMVDPLSGTEIVHQDGDLFVVGKPGPESIFSAFAPFDPWTNKALLWQIQMDFGITMHFDGRGEVTVNNITQRDRRFATNEREKMIREMLVCAINQRHYKPDTDYGGHVPLSMIQPTLVDRMQAVADAVRSADDVGPNEIVLNGADLPGGANHTAPDTGLAP